MTTSSPSPELSDRPPGPPRGSYPIPCPPFDVAAVWALLDSAAAGPWWLTWSGALALSTLGRLAYRWWRARRA